MTISATEHFHFSAGSGLLVAGTRSGCGKTSVSLGLMAALARRGLTVQPFKSGPDFIDPLHHARAAGRTSHNLDGWMLERHVVADIFQRHTPEGSVAVVEGAMGLFDGASGTSASGSSEELARWLALPVLLVVDASSMARSVAALVRGYLDFCPDLPFAGVVLNRVGSPAHAELLSEALEAVLPGCANPAPLLGLLPRTAGLELPSRHLGLVTPEPQDREPAPEREEDVYDRLAGWVEEHLDLDALLRRIAKQSPGAAQEACSTLESLDLQEQAAIPSRSGAISFRSGARPVMGVARDAAFCFCYAENLRLLEAAGADLKFFSPLTDQALPPGLDGLYLPGGYPELHAARLAGNRTMLDSVREFCASGRSVYAECGGFLYLLSFLRDAKGREHALCGVFSGRAALHGRFRALGYRSVVLAQDSRFGPSGLAVRGHAFHYSELIGPSGGRPVYDVADRRGRSLCCAGTPPTKGFSCGGWLGGVQDNVLGSYVHLHFASNPAFPRTLVQSCALSGG
jgi:cobyrinic acid a,c-diamide synthase